MKNSEDIRADNLEKLLSERAKGVIAAFAEMTKKDRTLISRWRPTSKNRKVISPKTAREIEAELKLPRNWMDQDHSTGDPQEVVTTPGGARPISIYHPEEPLGAGEFTVPAVNIRVGAGSRIVNDPVETEGLKRYSCDWAIKYGLKPECLIRYQVHGESMDPVIKDGAWILVEMGDFPIRDGMPYLIRAGEDVQVKFLFRRPDGGVIIRSHNPASPDVILTASERGSMAVLGRVVESVQMWIKPNGRKVG